jgi:hypothetical protein
VVSTLELRVMANGEGAREVVPFVDGTSLVELVGSFERQRGLSPAGGYAGIIPAHFNFGDLTRYYLGVENQRWPRAGTVWLLGCDCGEVGCWPLEARIERTDEHVKWSGFRQPFRTQWRYDDFGPFTFERGQYDAAVTEAVRLLQPGD